MIRIVYIMTVAAIIAFAGCVETSTVKFENQQQQNFDNFLAEKRKMSHNQGNDIQKKEFYNQFEKDLFNYIDSVKLFVNWKGTIKDIKTKESGKSTSVEYEIVYQPEQYRKVTFRCTHLVETANLGNDYIYNIVKNLNNNSTVYFDGHIRTSNKDLVYYDWRSAGDELNIPYPQYYLWIIDIGATKRNDSLSDNLKKAVEVSYKIIQPLRLRYQNKISKAEEDKMLKGLVSEFESVQSHLTDEEKLYVQRLNTSLTNNFLYGGN